MSGAAYMLLDAGFAALAAKFERDVLLAKVREMEARGSSQDQITLELRNMAITAAQDAINRSTS